MKKQIITIVLALVVVILGTNMATAQNRSAQNANATTTVNIALADVIAIDQTASAAVGGVVNFEYSTAEDYNSDQTINVPNSLVVTSTKSFDIKVKADGPKFENGRDFIHVDVLTIKPVMGGTSTMTGTPSNVVLSPAKQTLISGADLGSALVLELEYFIPKAKSSSPAILGKPAGTYTQTVTYTATAK